MKSLVTFLKVAGVVSVLLIIISLVGWWFFSGDRMNRWGRAQVSYLDGNYQVTYAVAGFNKSWLVKDGKVTSEPEKGYYFFWDEKKQYVQTPILSTIIEEVK